MQQTKQYPVTHTDAEWRKLLTPEQYHIMREHGTERPGSCALLYEKRQGTFVCAGCDQPLFVSKMKFESGTGWPSFNDPVAGAVETTEDRTYGMLRTEVHCSRCGSHLGHVFPDGPPPTGLRYCINGVATKFQAGRGVAAVKRPAASPARGHSAGLPGRAALGELALHLGEVFAQVLRHALAQQAVDQPRGLVGIRAGCRHLLGLVLCRLVVIEPDEIVPGQAGFGRLAVQRAGRLQDRGVVAGTQAVRAARSERRDPHWSWQFPPSLEPEPLV